MCSSFALKSLKFVNFLGSYSKISTGNEYTIVQRYGGGRCGSARQRRRLAQYGPARASEKSGSFVLHDEMPGSELEYRDKPGKSGMVGS